MSGQARLVPRFHYVYILESGSHPDRPYVGMTTDLHRRLAEHNDGKSKHTSKYRPWTLRVAIAFPSRPEAAAFERYRETHPGRAFARKRWTAPFEAGPSAACENAGRF